MSRIGDYNLETTKAGRVRRMIAKRIAGPGAGSEKYDLLTAMAVAGLSGTTGQQCTMLRLIALITARYNWSADDLSVGQREMAQMWSVDERTVKREIKRMVGAELLIQKRAGVRGRVAQYRLNIAAIYRLSAPLWGKVGHDFVDRMDQRAPRADQTLVRVDFQSSAARNTERRLAPWDRVMLRLGQDHPTSAAAWFSGLTCRDDRNSNLTLEAPSRFVAQYVRTHLMDELSRAVRSELGPAHSIDVCAPGAA